jgi:hypothetical protein
METGLQKILIGLRYVDIYSRMEDLLARIRSLIPEKTVSVEWLTGLLGIMAIYGLGYLCGILPVLLHRERRRLQEQSATLCEEILQKICAHEELYNQYARENDSSKRALLGGQITVLKNDVKQLEFRLAMLQQRDPRELPLRPLPVGQLKIE